MDNREIMVSVIMPVYNHEKYIAQAIEGVLMQKTTFRYELIIGEDCSTDDSRKIIKGYEEKYPDIIKVIYHAINQGGPKNARAIRMNAKGKYWAYCEGDDYWTDCNKLQKQVDFLEKNAQYSAVYHNVVCVDKKGRPCKRKSINLYPWKSEGEYIFSQDMLKGGQYLVGQTASLCCRNIYQLLGEEHIEAFEDFRCNGDRRMCVVLACLGKIYFLEDAMACYRVVWDEGSSWHARINNKNMLLHQYQSYHAICSIVKAIFGKDYCDVSYEKTILLECLRCAMQKTSIMNVTVCIKVSILYLAERMHYLYKSIVTGD